MDKPGPPPDGDQNASPGLLATTIMATIITVIILAARFWVRIRIVKKVGWDDWTILLAGLGHPIGMGLVITQIHYGFGRHRYYLSDYAYKEFEKFSYGEWMQTFATLMFTKVSICLFLLRIAVGKQFARPLQAGIFALITSNVVLTLLWILQCRPIVKSWNTRISGMCFTDAQLQEIILAQALVSVISDFMLAAFPIFLLRKVHISLRTKVGLCCLMGFGVITGSLCIVRTVLNWQTVTNDNTWASIPGWYWRTFEVFIGLVCATIPTLRPGYKQFKGTMGSYWTRLRTGSLSKKRSYQSFNDEEGILPPQQAHLNKSRTGEPAHQELYILKTTTIDVDPEMNNCSKSKSQAGLDLERI